MELLEPRTTPVDAPGSAPRPSGRAAPETSRASTRARVDGFRGSTAETILSRSLDVTVAAAVLIVLAPLLLVIALLVRTTSRGPAIFRQQRVGKDMRTFWVYKFRTMRPNASDAPHRKYIRALMSSDQTAQNGNLYKLVVDDRITRVGRFLRKSSLDEVPQLFNVLQGAMSLVGPRPVTAYEVELYPETYLRRFNVKPGLTGLWQVSGRSERTYHEMVALDLQYAEQRSLRLDLLILLKTIPVVLGRQGVA